MIRRYWKKAAATAATIGAPIMAFAEDTGVQVAEFISTDATTGGLKVAANAVTAPTIKIMAIVSGAVALVLLAALALNWIFSMMNGKRKLF